MEFSRLAIFFSELEKNASRNAMTEILARLFKEASEDEIKIICYLSLGRLAPAYESLEFQLAEKMVMRVLAQEFKVAYEDVWKEYKKTGDLGEVAEGLTREGKIKQKQSGRLSIENVYLRLRRIAEESGQGSQQRKVDRLATLLGELDAQSCRYVVRMVVGVLRLGFSDVTILDALSWMKTKSKELRPQIEKAYFVRADIGQIAQIFKKRGMKGLQGIGVMLGVPIMPALCQRLKSADEMVEKMGKVAADPKYDGQRVQIHYKKFPISNFQSAKSKDTKEWRVRAFTRNLEEVSFMFPELEKIGNQINAEEIILDSEAVGYDIKTGRILPFQEIITRKRKHAIAKAAQAVPLKFFVFDVLYLNGRSLINLPLSERAVILDRLIKGEQILVRTPRIVTDDANDLRKYHAEQLKKGLEGIVVKKWSGSYAPGRRGWSWVKFKESEEKAAKLADTLDCVVMGYYRGRGKRVQFGIGGFLVGILKGETIVTISKIGTGLSDEQWRDMKKRIKKFETRDKPKEYGGIDKNLLPDVWIQPQLVVEIAADNITKSPVHSAGLALRFPRLVRFRDDKNIGEATTLKEVERVYKLQLS